MPEQESFHLQSSETSDAALLRACRQGDSGAWEQLLERYERLVFSIARNSGLGRDDAADITQLTFSYLLQSLKQMTDEGNLRGWLATVAKRHSRRLLVRQLRYQSAVVDDEVAEQLMAHRSEAGGLEAGGVERWELAEWLRTGMALLDERCRGLLRALYLDENEPTYAEVAETFGLAEGSIGPIRARCLKRLKELL